MKLVRNQKSSLNSTNFAFTDCCYLLTCFIVPLLAAILSVVVDAISGQIILMTLQIADMTIIVFLIAFLHKKVNYFQKILLGPKNPKFDLSVTIRQINLSQIPQNEFQPIKSYFFRYGSDLVKIKYCYTCHMFKPPLTVHCSKCNECCLDFDHHCTWLKACICSKNYRVFICFLFALLVEGILIFCTSTFVWESTSNFWILQYVLISLSYLGGFALVGFVLVLLSFHLFLTIKGKSTYQFIKGRLKNEVFDEEKLQAKTDESEKVVIY